jgi:integrase
MAREGIGAGALSSAVVVAIARTQPKEAALGFARHVDGFVGKGRRRDLGKHSGGTKLAPDPRDRLYLETDVSLPVDFHSFRRAFNTALAEAGVNVQRAMHLASHSSARTHSRYVMSTKP